MKKITPFKPWLQTAVILATMMLMIVILRCGGGGNEFVPTAGFVSPTPTSSPTPHPGAESHSTIQITNVSISSPPVVDFVVNAPLPGFEPIIGLTTTNLRFGIAKLVPGMNGDNDFWQSYINRAEDKQAAEPGTAPDGTVTIQATTESTGTLMDWGDGSYTYTFATDLDTVAAPTPTPNPAVMVDLTFDETLTHRVGIYLTGTTTTGETPRGDGTFDFVPSGASLSLTHNVVNIASCNNCHNTLALHGGARFNTNLCVVCHNPGSTDANSLHTVNLAEMVHKIHKGEELANLPYSIWGNQNTEHNYDTVVFPQPLQNCTVCHDNTLAADADNYKTRPTMQACGACHDDIDFSTGANHPGGAQADNTGCIGCHSADDIESYHVYPPDIAAELFEFNILDIDNTAPGEIPIITFSVTDPTGAMDHIFGDAYHIRSVGGDPEFTNGSASLNVLIAWDTRDYTNTGTNSTPSRALSINARTTATSLGDGTFQVTSPIAIPLTAVGSGTVAIEGHPYGEWDPVGHPGVYVVAPVTNVYEHFPITDTVVRPRRDIVDIESCNKCHGRLSLHGSNRTSEPQVCVMCHNPDMTDIGRRPGVNNCTTTGVDGKVEETVDFKYLIHAIHAGDVDEHGFRENGIVIYGFGGSVNDFSHVRFPGILSDCRTCHLPGTYELPLNPDVLATTVQACDPTNPSGIAASKADPTDNVRIETATFSVCSACHDGGLP